MTAATWSCDVGWDDVDEEATLEVGVNSDGEWVDVSTGQPVPEDIVATRLFDRGPAQPLALPMHRTVPTNMSILPGTTASTTAGYMGFQGERFVPRPHQNYDNIAKNLWQGAYPTVRANKKFKAILNTADFGERYEVGDDVATLRVTFYDDPTGRQLPDIALVELLADWVNDRRAEGPVLVHCHMGLNRSGLVVAAALIREGMDPMRAVMTVRNRRPDALFNQQFVRMLMQVTPR